MTVLLFTLPHIALHIKSLAQDFAIINNFYTHREAKNWKKILRIY